MNRLFINLKLVEMVVKKKCFCATPPPSIFRTCWDANTQSLYPLNINSSFLPSLLRTLLPPSSESDQSRILEISGIIQGLSLCVPFISLVSQSPPGSANVYTFNSCMSSCRCAEKSQHGWGWGCVGHLSTHSPDLQKLGIFLVQENAVPLNWDQSVATQSLHCPQRGFLIITEWKIIAKSFFKPIIQPYFLPLHKSHYQKVLTWGFSHYLFFCSPWLSRHEAEGQARGLRTLIKLKM